MFERFTEEARDVVVSARDHATRLDDRVIGTEHLLLALVVDVESVATTLASFDIDQAAVEAGRTAVLAARQEDPVEADRDSLADLGIDLDQVRRMTDEAFGPGALDRARSGGDGRSRRTWRRRLGGLVATDGRLPFSPRAKHALELSLRAALRLGHREITAEHLALGVLAESEGLAYAILIDRDAAPARVAAAIERSLRRAA